MRGFLRAVAGAAIVAALAWPVLAQETGPSNGETSPIQGPPAPQDSGGKAKSDAIAQLSYAAWNTLALRTETIVAGGKATPGLLGNLRKQIVDWRAAFLAAQGANAARIATLRGQIEALGAPPGEGVAEDPSIAARRADLTDQLARLQAPVIEAEEAYSRANGLVAEIDRQLRERHAEALVRLMPSPLNPANWPAGLEALVAKSQRIASETATRARDPEARIYLIDHTPRILALLLLAGALIWRGRQWVERLPARLHARASRRGREVWALLVSLAQILVPAAGILSLTKAFEATGLLGLSGLALSGSIAVAGLTFFFFRWLGARLFPRDGESQAGTTLTAEDRQQGRLIASLLGALLGLEQVRVLNFDPVQVDEAAQSVMIFPGLAATALLLFRLGHVMRASASQPRADREGPGFRASLIAIAGRAAMIAAVAGGILGALGYMTAATNIIYPTTKSLALIGLVFILQRLAGDVFAMISGDEEEREALLPVLVGFILTLAALPVAAMIWGARWEEITELAARARDGLSVGGTRISLGDIATFAVVFSIGFLVTRLLQGALRSAILPKTRLDRGGQTAVVSGVGYVGILLALLVAINATGIDLSGLAIVAGALSVGIGFGLQTVVSNFVSGIILLVERPISEGDWIEVGAVSGVVKSISVRSTRIQTFDRSDVIVPNADLVTNQVTNWTRFSLSGRLIVPVSVAYGSDTRKVERILREIAENHPLVVMSPPPVALFRNFGTDGLDFEIRVILRDVNALPDVRSEINHMIGERFAAEKIEMPFAQRDLWLRNADEVANAFVRAGRILPGTGSGGPA